MPGALGHASRSVTPDFSRLLKTLKGHLMNEFFTDAATWKTKEDLFSEFFRMVSAPSWHGKNLDALWECIRSGDINAVNVPYRLVFKNFGAIKPVMKEHAEAFIDTIRQLAAAGVAIDIRTENDVNTNAS